MALTPLPLPSGDNAFNKGALDHEYLASIVRRLNALTNNAQIQDQSGNVVGAVQVTEDNVIYTINGC